MRGAGERGVGERGPQRPGGATRPGAQRVGPGVKRREDRQSVVAPIVATAVVRCSQWASRATAAHLRLAEWGSAEADDAAAAAAAAAASRATRRFSLSTSLMCAVHTSSDCASHTHADKTEQIR